MPQYEFTAVGTPPPHESDGELRSGVIEAPDKLTAMHALRQAWRAAYPGWTWVFHFGYHLNPSLERTWMFSKAEKTLIRVTDHQGRQLYGENYVPLHTFMHLTLRNLAMITKEQFTDIRNHMCNHPEQAICN